jgi:hypothetical protein
MKPFLLLATLLLSATWVLAQSNEANQGNSNSQHTTSSQNNNDSNNSGNASSGAVRLRGCLRQSNGEYQITDLETGTSYALYGGADLQKHVGRDVRVMGQPTGTSGQTGTAQKGPTQRVGQSATENPFQVQSIRDMGECSQTEMNQQNNGNPK